MDTTAPPSTHAQLDDAAAAFLQRIVASARDYLGAQVAFVAELDERFQIVRAAAGAGLRAGDRLARVDTYCHRVLDGELPEAIYDARNDPRTRDLALTSQLDIESYMGVPVVLPGGRVFGTLCCINFPRDAQARTRDLDFMHFLAGLVGGQLDDSLRAHDLRMQRHGAIDWVLSSTAAPRP